MVIGLNKIVIRVCVHLIFAVCVIAREETAESELVLFDELNYSNKTLNKIVLDVCDSISDLEDPVCLRNLQSFPQLEDRPSALWITKSDGLVQYQISPTNVTQVIIMVADYEKDVVQHLLEPQFTTETVALDRSLNYTFWTAAIVVNGSHSPWLQGPKLLALNNDHHDKQGSQNIIVNDTIKNYKNYSDIENVEPDYTAKNYKNYDGKSEEPESENIIADYTIENYSATESQKESESQEIIQNYTMINYKNFSDIQREEPERQNSIANYNITIVKNYSDMDICECANVTFSWTIYDDSDTPFSVLNDCSGDMTTKKVPRKPGETEGKYSINIFLGTHNCYFRVKDDNGVTGGLRYDIEPDAVTIITLFASRNGTGWDVHVGWDRPVHIPDSYRVVLLADQYEYPRNVSGNASEYTFYGVKGREMDDYNVSVCAFKGPKCMQDSIGAVFQPEKIASSSVPVLGSLLAMLVLAIMLISSVVWFRRRRHLKLKHLYQEDPEDFPKKLFPDIICDTPVVDDSWEIRPEKLQLHEVIGEGAFGVVRRGTIAPGKPVAVKMLKDYPSRDEVRSFRAEMELMKSVGAHPHVVSLVGCCSGRRPLIVAEYCSRGDLLSYLRCSWDVMVSKRNAKYCNNNFESSNCRNDLFKDRSYEHSKLVVNKLYDFDGVCDVELTYVDLLSFCRQIAMGMEFLASNRVVHRDLAARNVLVTSDRTLKIADFGLSRDIYQENQYKQKGNGKMPVKWMALESLTHRIYTTQSDVWSFGVVVWEVVTVGGSPYPEVPPARLPRLLRSGYRMPRPHACREQLYELMLDCWRTRPRDRPTFAELHAALDAMLHSACAEQYLALDLDAADFKPDEPRSVYSRLMELARGKLRRGSNYAAPARTHRNHYSSPPAPGKPFHVPLRTLSVYVRPAIAD